MLSKIVTIIQRGGGQALKHPHIGAILIEFARAIPVIIAIIYYLHDIPKYRRMQEKMNLCAHETVNILQNISQNRVNKRVTLNDIRHAASAAYLSIYPGTAMWATTPSYPMKHQYGHASCGYITCVKGMSGGKAKVVWRVLTHTAGFMLPSNAGHTVNGHVGNTVIKNAVNSISNPSSIYKDLRINEGEMKLLTECSVIYGINEGGFAFNDGRLCSDVSIREALGFWILNPKYLTNYDDVYHSGGMTASATYFNTVIIFTPKPGLFDETAPS
jgi:hypothetical protein